MSAQSTVSKLSKSDRKLQKKIAKSQRTLLKHEGIETSEKTTKVGITTGRFCTKRKTKTKTKQKEKPNLPISINLKHLMDTHLRKK